MGVTRPWDMLAVDPGLTSPSPCPGQAETRLFLAAFTLLGWGEQPARAVLLVRASLQNEQEP